MEREGEMPSKPVYCRTCKGYGETYARTVTRWGDNRIKSRGKPVAVPCGACNGTGYIAAKARPRPEWAATNGKADTNDIDRSERSSKGLLPEGEEL
jgi:DnaJ-class molecular chaperone